MTPNERLLAVFQGKQPDVIPWHADLTYWYNAQRVWDKLPEAWRGDGVRQMYLDLRAGCHEHALFNPWRQEFEGTETRVETYEEGAVQLQRTQWHTPVGSLTQVKQYEPQAATWAYRKYPVASQEDLRTLRWMYEHLKVTPNFAPEQEALGFWKDWGLPSSVPPRSPMAHLIVIWAGVMNASYALADCPEEIERTLWTMHEAEDPIYEACAKAPAPLVYFGENITGEVVSPSLFDRYYRPFYEQRVPQLHSAGKYVFVHVDGAFRNILKPLAATGVDCAQSLTPAPVGDVPVCEMRQVAGPDLILWGGVPAAFFSPLYPEQALIDIVLECLRRYKHDGKFMLCVCDQVPPDGIIDRVRLVSELVEEYGVLDH